MLGWCPHFVARDCVSVRLLKHFFHDVLNRYISYLHFLITGFLHFLFGGCCPNSPFFLLIGHRIVADGLPDSLEFTH